MFPTAKWAIEVVRYIQSGGYPPRFARRSPQESHFFSPYPPPKSPFLPRFFCLFYSVKPRIHWGCTPFCPPALKRKNPRIPVTP